MPPLAVPSATPHHSWQSSTHASHTTMCTEAVQQQRPTHTRPLGIHAKARRWYKYTHKRKHSMQTNDCSLMMASQGLAVRAHTIPSSLGPCPRCRTSNSSSSSLSNEAAAHCRQAMPDTRLGTVCSKALRPQPAPACTNTTNAKMLDALQHGRAARVIVWAAHAVPHKYTCDPGQLVHLTSATAHAVPCDTMPQIACWVTESSSTITTHMPFPLLTTHTRQKITQPHSVRPLGRAYALSSPVVPPPARLLLARPLMHGGHRAVKRKRQQGTP